MTAGSTGLELIPTFLRLIMSLLRFLVLVTSLIGFGALTRAENVSTTLALSAGGKESFPAIKLRAYGTLSAERHVLPGQPQASVLVITCESEAKAQLVLAKYLSDLGELAGVNPLPLDTARGKVSARQIDNQGAIAAARAGLKVYILTAADGPALKALVEDTLPAGTTINATDAEIKVPMYVDRWDKYGFRFYYGPFVKPDGATTYDPTQDFTFAKQSGDAGLVVWTGPAQNDQAEGITDTNSRQWVYDAAKKLDLPLGINLGINDGNMPLINRYQDQMAPDADGYLGGWYGSMNFGGRTAAWSSDLVQNIALGQLQLLVRDLKPRYGNIVNWLEPHEEMCHGNADLVDDHGPAAKTSFHNYLKSKYGTPDAVAKHWSEPGAFKAWDDIPFPELATFLGWNDRAIDLTGTWKISYTAPYGADSAKPDLDDSAWEDIPAPGHAIAVSIPRKPAVFRRHIKINPAWHAAHPKVWLYLWDFNDARNTTVLAFLNGKALPETDDTLHLAEHSCALDVSSALVDGDNVITLCLPQAMIDYRCYLSGDAPKVYPALGPQLNAEWADFSDWICWSRGQALRHGMQMIRQVDPDRPITLMSPDAYLTPIKAAAEDYGGIVHDTGGMAGSWVDIEPVLMESSGLATDCEPGGGAVDLNDFKRFTGRWIAEGGNGVDYFQHIGDIEWKPAVKDYFSKTLNLWHLIGKYHLPPAELALLASDRNGRLLGFPWDVARDPNVVFTQNRWWPLVCQLRDTYPRAGIIENDFVRGNVDQYRVVLDGNTTIMEPETVEQIAKWVKKGGTFITYQQTGRHTSVLPDSWPISKLTGYTVTGIDKMTENGDGTPSRMLHPVAGQTVFDPNGTGWPYIQHSAGLSLKKWDPACVDLLQWNDGSIAAGMRKLGKGLVIQLGTNSQAAVPQVLEYLHVKHVLGSTGNPDVITRHFLSNNGLYDVWVLFNTVDKPATVTLAFGDIKPAFCKDVNTGESIPINNDGNVAKLQNIQLDNWQARAFLTPRGQLASAPADWFALQRGWWKGTAGTGAPIPPYKSKLTVNLTDDWAFKPLDGALPATGAPPEDPSLSDPKLDDSSWERRQIGIFDIPDHPGLQHGIFRRKFTIPAEWTHGKALLNGGVDTMGGGSREYVDGQLVDPREVNNKLGGTFTPGSAHVIAVEIWNTTPPVGTNQPIFLSYRPDPISRQPIKDNWAYASDYLKFDPPKPLPFTETGYGAWRTVAHIDAGQSGHNVVFHSVTDNNHQHAILINGHALLGAGNYDVNITPWVKFGQDNEIMVTTDNTTMQDASLDYYDKDAYP
jgi:hypothetical protein